MMPYGGHGNQGWNNQWPSATVDPFGMIQNQQIPLLGLIPQYLGHSSILPTHNLYNPTASVMLPNQALNQWQHQQWQYNLQDNK